MRSTTISTPQSITDVFPYLKAFQEVVKRVDNGELALTPRRYEYELISYEQAKQELEEDGENTPTQAQVNEYREQERGKILPLGRRAKYSRTRKAQELTDAIAQAGFGLIWVWGELSIDKGKIPKYLKKDNNGEQVGTSKNPVVSADDREDLAQKIAYEGGGLAITPLAHWLLIDADTPQEVNFLKTWWEEKTGYPLPPATVSTPGTKTSGGKNHHTAGGHWYIALSSHQIEALDGLITDKALPHAFTVDGEEEGQKFDVKVSHSYALIPPTHRVDGGYTFTKEAVDILGNTPEEYTISSEAFDALLLEGKKGKKQKKQNKNKKQNSKRAQNHNTYSSIEKWEEQQDWGAILQALNIEVVGSATCGVDCLLIRSPQGTSPNGGYVHNGCEHGTGLTAFSSTLADQLGIEKDLMIPKGKAYALAFYGGDFQKMVAGEGINTTKKDMEKEAKRELVAKVCSQWSRVDLNDGGSLYKKDGGLLVQREKMETMIRNNGGQDFIDKTTTDDIIVRIDESEAYALAQPPAAGIGHFFRANGEKLPGLSVYDIGNDNVIFIDKAKEEWEVTTYQEAKDKVVDAELLLYSPTKRSISIPEEAEGGERAGKVLRFFFEQFLHIPTTLQPAAIAALAINMSDFSTSIEKPIYFWQGEQRSGKSTGARYFKGLFSPGGLTSAGEREDKQLYGLFDRELFPAFDNVEKISKQEQNRVAGYVTGNNEVTRQYYTTAEFRAFHTHKTPIYTCVYLPRLNRDFASRCTVINVDGTGVRVYGSGSQQEAVFKGEANIYGGLLGSGTGSVQEEVTKHYPGLEDNGVPLVDRVRAILLPLMAHGMAKMDEYSVKNRDLPYVALRDYYSVADAIKDKMVMEGLLDRAAFRQKGSLDLLPMGAIIEGSQEEMKDDSIGDLVRFILDSDKSLRIEGRYSDFMAQLKAKALRAGVSENSIPGSANGFKKMIREAQESLEAEGWVFDDGKRYKGDRNSNYLLYNEQGVDYDELVEGEVRVA